MTAYANLSEFINRKTGGNSGSPDYLLDIKTSRVNGGAATTTLVGRWFTMWRFEGTTGAGAIPGAVTACDNTTVGGWGQAAPGGGRQKFLDSLCVATGPLGMSVLVYDRLLQCGGLSGIVTTAQAVGGAITRNVNGDGNQIWLEVHTQVGATNTTATISYTNQAGTAGRTATVSFGGTNHRENQRALPVTLQSGDSGVRSVENVTLAATTATAGDFSVVIAKPIVLLGSATISMGQSVSFLDGDMPDVGSSCIAYMALPGTAASNPSFVAVMASMTER